jgi:hypothetical protein
LSRIVGRLAIVMAVALPGAARAATYTYEVSHATYGVIGTYTRSSAETEIGTRAEAHLNIVVKILGLTVRREASNQVAIWRGQRLVSLQSLITTNGRKNTVSGVAAGDRFVVTTPAGTANAPADVVASDPFTLNRMGRGTVVSTRTGKITPAVVTGGETETIAVRGVTQSAKHYHVNTPGQADKWEVWIDPRGVPIKFRSLESGGSIDFNLISGPSG